jgi:ribosomal protein S18 acetylase RimI-like enzyme
LRIRAFDGSLGDARAIIEIDRATFADCPYTAEQIVALESDAGQYAWVAEEGGRILGYVSAFATHSLAAGRWEIDELAVHPEAQGRGIGTALVARALAAGARQAGLQEARALVAVGNLASQRVFLKNGFRVVDTVDLVSYRPTGRAPRPPRPGAPAVRLARAGDCAALAGLLGGEGGDAARVEGQLLREDTRYLVAVSGGEPPEAAPGNGRAMAQVGRKGGREMLGAAELIHVRTLQYEGLWIEALAVTERGAEGHQAALALFGAAIGWVKRRKEMDLVGFLASSSDRGLYSAAVAEGMTWVETYRSFVYEWQWNV